MLDQLTAQPPDALLALIKLHAEDPRADKIDLGVGVYRDADGGTPVFKAIKAAEKRLLESQDSKGYLGPEGDMGFVRGLMPHIFGDSGFAERIDGVQTPGGTGAVRLATDLLKAAGVKRIFLGTPSWPNHVQIFKAAGVETVTFEHLDTEAQRLNFACLQEILAEGGAGDALLLHGCCHNPTGADYIAEQWNAIADSLKSSGMLPLLDLAYHGLGHGFEVDSAGVRTVLENVPAALIAYSCDKNFGMYRDRVGALYCLAEKTDKLPAIMSNVYALARSNWSMPPDHGAAAIRIILEDEALTADWHAEVESMRARMRRVRDRLAAAGDVGGIDFAPLGTQNGLFSMLPLSKNQIFGLREQHGIYMAGSGRINIAGLTLHNIDRFIDAVRAVTSF